MSNIMEIEVVTQKGNYVKARLSIWKRDNTFLSTVTSREFVINHAALFQVRVTAAFSSSIREYYSLVFVRFVNRRYADNLNYMIHINSVDLNIVGKTFTSVDGTWHLIHEVGGTDYTFDVAVEMELQPSANLFASLYEDTELTDFELRGEDGSVPMHRAVLAAASPVLRRMLGGAWRETAEGHVEVTGTSKATLEHFKNYVYQRVLPESGLQELLLLSSYYMMPELERLCVDRLVRGVSAGNACDLIEFALKNNVKQLLVEVLELVQNDAISVMKICDHLDKSDDASNTTKSTANTLA